MSHLGYSQLKVASSVGLMRMFILDTESEFRNVVTVTGAYDLGEFVVQGAVMPDRWTVFKPTLAKGCRRCPQ